MTTIPLTSSPRTSRSSGEEAKNAEKEVKTGAESGLRKLRAMEGQPVVEVEVVVGEVLLPEHVVVVVGEPGEVPLPEHVVVAEGLLQVLFVETELVEQVVVVDPVLVLLWTCPLVKQDFLGPKYLKICKQCVLFVLYF